MNTGPEIGDPPGEANVRVLYQALQQSSDIVLVTDGSGTIRYVNPAFERSTGYRRDEVLGQQPDLLRTTHQDAGFYEKLWQTLLAGHAFHGVVEIRRKDGRTFYEEKTITPFTDPSGTITHFVSTGRDISERRETERRLHYLAYFDPLTRLPNRVLLRLRLEQAMRQAQRHGQRLAVLSVDLDRFKDINDSLGHEAGDRLLRQVARRVRFTLRKEDTVARVGSDELVVLLTDITQADDAARVAEKIRVRLDKRFVLGENELHPTASIGIAVYPQDHENAQSLLRNADLAMQQAKAQGGNCYRFYSRELGKQVVERIELERALQLGLSRKEFSIHFQPQFELVSGRIIGMEALLRWHHPQQGPIAPERFIPLAETIGSIVQLGDHALWEACSQMARWRAAGFSTGCIAVNLSPHQLSQADLPQRVARILYETRLPPKALMLELTESAMTQRPEQAATALHKLKAIGVRLGVDDFGTGYSSLSYLRRFPLDCVKIDRSFVSDLPMNPDAVAIVSAIIGMAHSLGMSVIAEGVETQAQLEFLRHQDCEGIQGFLVGHPLPAAELKKVIDAGSFHTGTAPPTQ